MAAASALQVKRAAGDLLWILAVQAVLVSQMVNNGILLPPPPSILARSSAAGLCHQQTAIAVLHSCMLSTAFAAAFLLLNVRRQAGVSKEAQPPSRMLRASMLLAVALSLASAVLAAATLYYVLQVRMATVYSCLPGAAKATLWAAYAVAGFACTSCHYHLAALAIWYQ